MDLFPIFQWLRNGLYVLQRKNEQDIHFSSTDSLDLIIYRKMPLLSICLKEHLFKNFYFDKIIFALI